jgi:hypothetical protein
MGRGASPCALEDHSTKPKTLILPYSDGSDLPFAIGILAGKGGWGGKFIILFGNK